MYKFPTRRKAKVELEQVPVEEKTADAPLGHIQNKAIGSTQELWVAMALNRLKIPYTYQYPVFGGRQRGGYMIDFVVHTVPLATMIEPVGNHWHTGELGADDRKRQADIEDAMQDVARTPIVLLWIPDLLDEETVFQKLQRELL